MKTFERWLRDKHGIEMPHGTINEEWFAENGLPMIVECCYCGSTMATPSAYVDKFDYVYCQSCAGE